MRTEAQNENLLREFKSKYKGMFIFMDNPDNTAMACCFSQLHAYSVRVSLRMETDHCGQRPDFKWIIRTAWLGPHKTKISR